MDVFLHRNFTGRAVITQSNGLILPLLESILLNLIDTNSGSVTFVVFEEQVTWLVAHTSRSVVSELMRIEWHTIGDVCTRVYKDLESGATSRFDGLVNIGIDETSYKKDHKYLTVVLNHDTNSVVWCSAGFGKEVLSRFFEILTPEQRDSIRCVSADGARWIASCIKEYCPNATLC